MWRLNRKTSLATYKCVVVFGRFFAISSRLLPTDVHLTVSPKSSNLQLQFPATEHKNGDSKPLPSSLFPPSPLPLSPLPASRLPPSPLPASPLTPSPLQGPGGGHLCCNVTEMTKLHTRMWTPQNIVWCYFESKWPFELSSTHSICSQSSIQVRPNEGKTADILLIWEYSVLCYSTQERSQQPIVTVSESNTYSLVHCNALQLQF